MCMYRVELTHSNAQAGQEDWPKWLVDGISHLQGVSLSKRWGSLVESFVVFEGCVGHSGAVGGSWGPSYLAS